MNTIILEATALGDLPLDVYQKLADDRILFLYGMITDEMAAHVTATLLLKDHEDPEKKITLFINSQGGNIRNVLMIYDIIQLIESPVETVCVGSALDEAAILLAAGTPGSRLATRNSIICVGQLEHDMQAHVNMVDAKKILQMASEDNARMMNILAQTTNKTIKQVREDFDRPVFMNSAKALKYRIIDKIVPTSK